MGETSGYLPRGRLDEACQTFGIAYDKAAELSRIDLENAWRFGREAIQLKKEGHLCGGNFGSKNGTKILDWEDLGLPKSRGSEYIKLAMEYELDELIKKHETECKPVDWKIPSLSRYP